MAPARTRLWPLALGLVALTATSHAAVLPGDLVIREFRLRGPVSALDEYIVIHNRTAADITIAAGDSSAGFGVARSDGTLVFTIPNGTLIKARGHFLGVNTSAFSLGVQYDAGWTTDIPDGLGLALFDRATPASFGTTAVTLDAVGVGSSIAPYLEGTALTALTSPGEFAWVRKAPLGAVLDTNANSSDFALVSTNGGIYNGVQSILGTPAPSNSSNQDVSAGMTMALAEPLAGTNTAPNRVQVSTPSDHFEFRRRITNNTGSAVSALRLRFTDITTLQSPGYTPGTTQADLRPVTSTTAAISPTTSTGVTSVNGLTLLTPPAQAIGGGLNSVLTIPGSLANGASVNVNIALNLARAGTYSFNAAVETTGTLAVATPAMSPPGATYQASQSVSLSTTTVGAAIRYTTNGTTPTAASTLYSSPVSMTQTTTLKAIAILSGWANSAVGTGVYTLQAPPPTISPNGGSFVTSQAVTLSTTVPATFKIRYTTNGTTPTATSTLYSAPFNVTTPTTVKAIVIKTGWTTSAVASAVFSPTVATPSFSPVAGTYGGTQTVTLSTTTAGATIRYTTDGTTPTAASTLYSAPVSVTQTTTLKAIASLASWTDSAVGTAMYTLQTVAPTISPNGGTFAGSQPVTLATTTAAPVSIRYTTDGTTPTPTSTLYGAPFNVTTPTTVKAITVKAGWSDSAVATSAAFTPTVATPTFSPVAATYTATQSVTLATTTAGGTIRYTTDGSTPTVASPAYSTAISLTQTTTLKAAAFLASWAASAIATAAFVIQPPPPVISPASGTYQGDGFWVTMSSPPATEIWYTTNGTVPTSDTVVNPASKKYTASFLQMTNVTLIAVTVGPSGTTSAAASTSVSLVPPDAERTPKLYAAGAPTGSHALSGFETVNLYNGNLQFRLPLLNVGARGEARFNIGLAIAPNFRVHQLRVGLGGPGNPNEPPPPLFTPQFEKWQIASGYGPGAMIGKRVVHDGQRDVILSFVEADGTEHELHGESANWGGPASPGPFPCATNHDARAGSAATFVADAPVCVDGNAEFTPTGDLHLRDGRMYRIEGGLVAWFRDRNGNKASQSHCSQRPKNSASAR